MRPSGPFLAAVALLAAPLAGDAQLPAKRLKTAKALGLTVPQSVLLRADHVIQ